MEPQNIDDDVRRMIRLSNTERESQFWPKLYHLPDELLETARIGKKERRIKLRALWYAEMFDIPSLAKAVYTDLHLSISDDGKGRKEAVTAYTASKEEQAHSWLNFFRRKEKAP